MSKEMYAEVEWRGGVDDQGVVSVGLLDSGGGGCVDLNL